MYFIGVMFIDEKNPKAPSVRCVGYFKEKEEAVYTVENNVCDIFEYTYNYAVIERIEEGLYQVDIEPTFFKYNFEKEAYEECEKPAIIGPYVGLCLG
jgi:hypothetical protein